MYTNFRLFLTLVDFFFSLRNTTKPEEYCAEQRGRAYAEASPTSLFPIFPVSFL